MADVEPKAPTRRRTQKSGEAPARDRDTEHVEGATDRRHAPEKSGTRDGRDDAEQRAAAGAEEAESDAQDAPSIDPGVMARRAAGFVARLSGRRPESVISIERKDAEWRVGVEVIEVSRIPDSADILAVYEVRLDADGDLISYRRIRRYARGQLDWERQR